MPTIERPARLDLDDFRAYAETARPPDRAGTPRFLARVYDGGAIPTAAGRVYLTRPVAMGGGEIEGFGAGLSIDESRSIPVVILGTRAAKAGDLVEAFAVDGRWVAWLGGPSTTVPCADCTIPKASLTLTIVNSLTGVSSAVLAFDGVDSWATGCLGQVRYRLRCQPAGITFTVNAHLASACPDGASVACANPGSSPGGLTLLEKTCDPFVLRYSSAGCPSLASQGFTEWRITA